MTNEDTSGFEEERWYEDALGYWSATPATINGMLGGYGSVTSLEAKGSMEFISEYVRGKRGAHNALKVPPRISTQYACDCGAGIGRVSKHFLLKIFDKVDLVEYTPKFIQHAERTYLAKEKSLGRIGKFMCLGLQEFTPEEGKYDLIWCQWVLGHLKDDDLEEFFKRCKKGLKPNGMIGVKENVSVFGYRFDKNDSSVTRYHIYRKAGLSLLKEATQHGMPDGLYEVKMYALEPKITDTT
ncbi:2079_t:CDS:2 [Acaulospora morrowiae]|uniref:Alpha N-terminal protein methyltransferase 1 n=1 Tax=Acaulospora morrowiae TaxID=94023 RepID=A0A9N8YQK2_9GLOM|nr:2079_t:CDS:2 [Acaulospora morrowiae]